MIPYTGKIEQILLAYDFPKETVMAIILYKYVKAMVHSLDSNTDYFDVVARVLQGNTLASFLFIICLHYILQTPTDHMKENGLTLKKGKK